MLPDHLKELLTAAVDGELTPAQRAAVKRLLRDSEEARVFFARLKEDSQRMRRLPAVRPAADLATGVLRAINERNLTPTPLPPERSRRQFAWSNPAAWAGVAAAAVVLLTVSVASYLYFAASQNYLASSNRGVASNRAAQQGSDLTVVLPPQGNNPSSPRVREPEVAPAPRELDPALAQVGPEPLPFPPRTVPSHYPLATPAGPEVEMIHAIHLRLALILPLRDLDQAYPRQKLREEVAKDEVVRLELFCKDTARGLDLVQSALKGRGHALLVDALAQRRLKDPKHSTEYVLYTECLTPDDLVKLLEQLGAEDRKLEAKKSGDGLFDKFVLAPFQAADLDKLARLLGVPPAQVKVPGRKSAAIDVRRPISDGTGPMVAESLTKNAPKQPQKMTLVLPYSPVTAKPAESKEIKQFVEKRGERKPGTTPVMLVLRTLGS